MSLRSCLCKIRVPALKLLLLTIKILSLKSMYIAPPTLLCKFQLFTIVYIPSPQTSIRQHIVQAWPFTNFWTLSLLAILINLINLQSMSLQKPVQNLPFLYTSLHAHHIHYSLWTSLKVLIHTSSHFPFFNIKFINLIVPQVMPSQN